VVFDVRRGPTNTGYWVKVEVKLRKVFETGPSRRGVGGVGGKKEKRGTENNLRVGKRGAMKRSLN